MRYRNGIKEYLLMALIYGIPMGLLFVLKSNILTGTIMGVLSGMLFAFIIFLFIKFQEKKFDKKRVEIAKERRIICDGAATIQGTGGWLFLTELGIEFYPHKINVSREELKIPINMIRSVTTNKNQIIIYTTPNFMYTINVSHNKEWKKQIDGVLAGSIKE